MPQTTSRIGHRRKKSWPFQVLGRAVIEAMAHPEAGSLVFNALLPPMRRLILRQQPPDRRRIWDDALSLLTAMWTTMLRAGPTRRMGKVLHDVVATYSDTVPGGSPGFLVISPGKACNLRCPDCYANSATEKNALDYAVLSRIVREAKEKWSIPFFTITGGEPLFYRNNGKGVLDLCAENQDCMFLMYTNGFLINRKVAERMAEVGNITPAVSVEGMRERTDARRGAGVFDKILAAMQRLRRAGVPYGVSLTATRHNAEEILSDEFFDFFFEKHGALYGWIFHYMPIGRSYTLELMPTPEQRLWMWRRSWDIIRERQIMLADFWNHGTVTDGCISSGRFSGGGYMYIDWNGAVTPCVFVPYSPININQAYAQGKTLTDAWSESFFAGIRKWQDDYRKGNAEPGNWMAPCIIRDHHADFRRLVMEHEPDPADQNAADALLDPDYARGMQAYDEAYQSLSGEVWKQHYLRPTDPNDGHIEPLPEVPTPSHPDTPEQKAED